MDKRKKFFILKVDPSAGMTFEKAVSDAWIMALKMRLTIEFEYNSLLWRIYPDMTQQEIYAIIESEKK